MQGVAEVHHLQTLSLGTQDYKWGRGKLRLDIKQQHYMVSEIPLAVSVKLMV